MTAFESDSALLEVAFLTTLYADVKEPAEPQIGSADVWASKFPSRLKLLKIGRLLASLFPSIPSPPTFLSLA